MRLIVLLLLFGNPSSMAALSGEAKLALKSLKARYERLGNWRAKFTQHTHSKGSGGKIDHGSFYFASPSRFRHSLKGPRFSDFVSNGRRAWKIRYPEGPQGVQDIKVFKTTRGLQLERYLLIYRGLGKLTLREIARRFDVKAKVSGLSLFVSLEPKFPSDLAKIEFFFVNHIEAPTKVILTDRLGSSTSLKIASFEKLTKLTSQLFQVEIPSNARVEKL